MITGGRYDYACFVSADNVQEKCTREKNESDRNPMKYYGNLLRQNRNADAKSDDRHGYLCQ